MRQSLIFFFANWKLGDLEILQFRMWRFRYLEIWNLRLSYIPHLSWNESIIHGKPDPSWSLPSYANELWCIEKMPIRYLNIVFTFARLRASVLLIIFLSFVHFSIVIQERKTCIASGRKLISSPLFVRCIRGSVSRTPFVALSIALRETILFSSFGF